MEGRGLIREGCDRGQLKALVYTVMNFGVSYTEWNSWLVDVWYFCLITSLFCEIICIFTAFLAPLRNQDLLQKMRCPYWAFGHFYKEQNRWNESNSSPEIRSDDLLHILCSSGEQLFSRKILHLSQRLWHLEFTSISLKHAVLSNRFKLVPVDNNKLTLM